ncbi:MAG: alpha/beta fold hydrolase [Candidatus Eremiobacteraeota bacterium]|nr:alpha/beta fold hydrolase [Candidatus Eremiobacteraeota bacterium]MBV8498633.1 alpha/beta fold hydrolase [Candidatus Eremiobacteraeota bacterium]
MLATAFIAALAGHLHTWPCTAGQARVSSTCGTYTVYENRATRSGRTIDLSFIVIKAAHPSHRAIVWNPGGPGASSTASADAVADGGFPRELSALRDRYDVLLVDNRGTGKSAPQLCNFAPADRPALYFMGLWPDALVRGCRAKLARTADLSLYTTSNAADDLDELRAALGYPALVLDGGSYGTRFYLDYARRHPSSVESIVLDGVAPPGLLIIPLEDAKGAQDAVTHVITACRADVACNANFPSLEAHFDALVQRFDRGPVPVPLEDAASKRVNLVRLSKEVFADRLRQLLYDPAGAAYAPFIIQRAYLGDYAPLATMVDMVAQGLSQEVAGGLNLSVTCAEDVPFITESDVARTSASSFEGDLRVRAQQRACRIWDVAPAPASFVRPVRSDAPILMISGTDDPTSPPAYAREALRYLRNARMLLVRNASHGTETRCGDRIIVEFIRARSAKGLDLKSCENEYHRPPFATSMAGFGD